MYVMAGGVMSLGGLQQKRYVVGIGVAVIAAIDIGVAEVAVIDMVVVRDQVRVGVGAERIVARVEVVGVVVVVVGACDLGEVQINWEMLL